MNIRAQFRIYIVSTSDELFFLRGVNNFLHSSPSYRISAYIYNFREPVFHLNKPSLSQNIPTLDWLLIKSNQNILPIHVFSLSVIPERLILQVLTENPRKNRLHRFRFHHLMHLSSAKTSSSLHCGSNISWLTLLEYFCFVNFLHKKSMKDPIVGHHWLIRSQNWTHCYHLYRTKLFGRLILKPIFFLQSSITISVSGEEMINGCLYAFFMLKVRYTVDYFPRS